MASSFHLIDKFGVREKFPPLSPMTFLLDFPVWLILTAYVCVSLLRACARHGRERAVGGSMQGAHFQ